MNGPYIKDYSFINPVMDLTNILEMRMENDGNGNPIYIGYAKIPNMGTASTGWFIVKITYDVNQSPTHQQLPNQGVQFIYIWDDRANYF